MLSPAHFLWFAYTVKADWRTGNQAKSFDTFVSLVTNSSAPIYICKGLRLLVSVMLVLRMSTNVNLVCSRNG